MLNGRLYDGTTLDEVGNHPKKREPFFWQRQGGSVSTITSTRTDD
jgi:hypothetical protein